MNREQYQLYRSPDIVTTEVARCDERGTYKELAVIKYTEESWIPNSNEALECGDVNVGGWMVML